MKVVGFLVTTVIVALTAVVIVLRFQWDKELVNKNHSSQKTIFGYVAVLACILTFGSYGIFIKSPAVQERQVDPGIFQLYYATGVAGTLMCVAFYSNVYFNTMELLWGIIGAALLVPCQLFAYIAINSIGYAVAPAVWAGLTMVVSFLWGVLMFNEKLISLFGSIAGLLLLVIGVIGAASCQSSLPEKLRRFCLGRREETERLLSLQGSTNRQFDEHGPGTRAGVYVTGIGAAVLVGLLNGSLMVPFHYFHKEVNSDSAAISYLVNFAAGIAIVTPPVILLWLLGKHGCSFPKLHFYHIGIQGIMTGIYWACGYFAATYATQYLGNAVGYPLTQTCILINGLWGILYYQEIRGTAKITLFTLSAFVIIGGAVLLAKFGSKT